MPAIPPAIAAANHAFGGPLPLWASAALSAAILVLAAALVAFAAATAGGSRRAEER